MRHLYLSGMLSCVMLFSLNTRAQQLPIDTAAVKNEYNYLKNQYNKDRRMGGIIAIAGGTVLVGTFIYYLLNWRDVDENTIKVGPIAGGVITLASMPFIVRSIVYRRRAVKLEPILGIEKLPRTPRERWTRPQAGIRVSF